MSIFSVMTLLKKYVHLQYRVVPAGSQEVVAVVARE